MIDMDKYRIEEQKNGRITLEEGDGILLPTTALQHSKSV